MEKKARFILLCQFVLMFLVALAPYLEKGIYDFSLWPMETHKAIGLALNMFGALVVFWSVRTMNENFNVPAQQKKGAQLIKKGPFAYVRNPIYFAGTMLTLGWSISFLSWSAGILSLMLILVLVFKIRLEEHFLLEQFGDDYRDYCQKVPRLFPKLH